jgi:hypothetical protein
VNARWETPARPAAEKGERREWRGDVTGRGRNLEYGAVRRLPMRWEAAWVGHAGLPRSTRWRVTVRNEAGQSGGSRGRPHARCAAAEHAAGGHRGPDSRGACFGPRPRSFSDGRSAGGQTNRFVPTDAAGGRERRTESVCGDCFGGCELGLDCVQWADGGRALGTGWEWSDAEVESWARDPAG